MNIYRLAGMKYAVIGGELYACLTPETTTAAGTVVDRTDGTPLPPTTRSTKAKSAVTEVGKAKGHGKGHNRIHCKRCGENGHFAKTCPKQKAEDQPVQEPEKIAPGKFVGTVAELAERVKQIREDEPGISSLKVAAMLGVNLSLLNRVWGPTTEDEAEAEEEAENDE